MNSPLLVLHLEDDLGDARLVQATLAREGIASELTRCETEQEFIAVLERGNVDLILADYTLPSFDGLSALMLAQQRAPDVPFIFVSGTLGEDVAIGALKTGATDYVLKTRLARLAPAVRRAVHEAHETASRKLAEDALQLSEAYMAQAQRIARVGSWAYKSFDVCEHWSEETFRIFGFDPSKGSSTYHTIISGVYPEDRPRAEEAVAHLFNNGQAMDIKFRFIRPDGQLRVIRDIGTAICENGVITRIVGACSDVTDQELMTAKLRQSEFYLKEGERLAGMASWSLKTDGTFDYWSPEAFINFNFDSTKGIPTLAEMLTVVHPDDHGIFNETYARMLAEGVGCDITYRIFHPRRGPRIMHSVGEAVFEGGKIKKFIGNTLDITEREALTRELRRREAYAAEAQRLSHTGSFGWNPTTDEHFWSDETYRIWEYETSTKISFNLVIERIHPEDRSRVLEASAQVGGGLDIDLEYRLLFPGGAVKHIHACAHAVRNDPDNIEVFGAVTDISERKRAEETVRRSEAFLAEGQRLSRTGSWGWKPSTGELIWSRETFRIFDLDPDTTNPSHALLDQIIHPEDRLKVKEASELANREKGEFEKEYRIVTRNGVIRYLHSRGHSVVNEANQLVEFIGSVMDITDRKRTEDSVRRSEAFLAEGQRLSHTGSWTWRASTGEMIWSREAFRLLGYDPDTTKPTSELFWERVHPEDRLRVREVFDLAVREKRDYEQEYRIVTPDWVIRHIRDVAHAVVNEANELVEFMCSEMDITDRKRAEERARSEKEAFKRALSAFVEELDIEQFLRNVIVDLSKQFHAASSDLWLFDEATAQPSLYFDSREGGLVARRAKDAAGAQRNDVSPLWQPSIVGRAPQVVDVGAQNSTLQPAQREVLKAQGVETLMMVPLVIGEQNLGYFELRFRGTTRFTPDDLELAQALVNHATLALQLSRLAHRTERMAVTEERNRLAREIHDTLAQSFAGIVLHAEAMGASAVEHKLRSRRALSRIMKLARAGLDEARRSVQALRPKALDGSSLFTALKQEVKRVSDENKLACQFRQRGKKTIMLAEAQDELFRIAQEALTNVVKHAHAKSVSVTLEFKARCVRLIIQDDGIGIPAKKNPAQRRGFGLATMRERAQRIGGRLRIKRTSGRGSRICVDVPVPGKWARSDRSI